MLNVRVVKGLCLDYLDYKYLQYIKYLTTPINNFCGIQFFIILRHPRPCVPMDEIYNL